MGLQTGSIVDAILSNTPGEDSLLSRAGGEEGPGGGGKSGLPKGIVPGVGTADKEITRALPGGVVGNIGRGWEEGEQVVSGQKKNFVFSFFSLYFLSS